MECVEWNFDEFHDARGNASRPLNDAVVNDVRGRFGPVAAEVAGRLRKKITGAA
jgi:hypothetical protein